MKKTGALTDVKCDGCDQPIRSELPHGGYVEYYEDDEGKVYCETCSKG